MDAGIRNIQMFLDDQNVEFKKKAAIMMRAAGYDEQGTVAGGNLPKVFKDQILLDAFLAATSRNARNRT